jgi:hypothetical protein
LTRSKTSSDLTEHTDEDNFKPLTRSKTSSDLTEHTDEDNWRVVEEGEYLRRKGQTAGNRNKKILLDDIKMSKSFHYHNVEKRKHGKTYVVRKVVIKGGKGYKSVSRKHPGRKNRTVKRMLKRDEIADIKRGKFIGGLFTDCK